MKAMMHDDGQEKATEASLGPCVSHRRMIQSNENADCYKVQRRSASQGRKLRHDGCQGRLPSLSVLWAASAD